MTLDALQRSLQAEYEALETTLRSQRPDTRFFTFAAAGAARRCGPRSSPLYVGSLEGCDCCRHLTRQLGFASPEAWKRADTSTSDSTSNKGSLRQWLLRLLTPQAASLQAQTAAD